MVLESLCGSVQESHHSFGPYMKRFNQSFSVSRVEDSPIEHTMSRIFCFTKDHGKPFQGLLGKRVHKSDSWAHWNLPVSNEIVLASAGRSGAFGNTASVTLYPATNAAVWKATTGRRISRPNGDLIALMLTAKGEPMQHDVVKSDSKGRTGRINFVTWGRNLQKHDKTNKSGRVANMSNGYQGMWRYCSFSHFDCWQNPKLSHMVSKCYESQSFMFDNWSWNAKVIRGQGDDSVPL